MSNSNSSKQVLLTVIGVAILVIAVVGVTFAFFNYTRTGTANTIRTGRIYFNSVQPNNGEITLTNVFPMTSTEAGNANLDSVAITLEGDTTYSGGEEFLITIVGVNNTINGKTIPVNYIATYTAASGETIGTSSNDYYTTGTGRGTSTRKV